jgi:hypothetical protein
MTIRIANPQPGTATHVGLKRALRYVKNGRATLADNVLHFRIEHHAHQATLASQASSRGYDRDAHERISDLKRMANVPIINPREMLAPSARRNPRSPRMRTLQG